MYKIHDVSIITQEAITEIPNGPAFSTSNGMIVIHQDFSKLTFFNKNFSKIVDIKSLNLVQGRDVIHYAGTFNKERIYIYASKNKIPTGFLIAIEEKELSGTLPSESSFSFPRCLSFSLSSIVFHRKILSSFVPFQDSFCIVSNDGISIHSISLKTLFSVTRYVSQCCFVNNFLLCTDRFHVSIFRFAPETTPVLIYSSQISELGSPVSMVALSHSLVLVYADSKQNAVIQKIPLLAQKPQNVISIQKYFTQDTKVSTLTFNVFEDALLVCDKKNNRTVLLDLIEDAEIQIGYPFSSENPIYCVYNDMACCPKKSFVLMVHYEAIKLDDPKIIASLFRRSKALTRAITLFTQRLRESQTVESMKAVIDAIGPSATSAVAQIRFARAIQFSSIVDPHLITLALLRYSMILGTKMIDDARVCLFEAISHASCRNTLRNLLTVWNMKLNAHALRALVGKFNNDFVIDAENVSDVLAYADICIDFNKREEARKLILRFVLDEGKSALDLGTVRQKFIDHFGQDALQPVFTDLRL